MTLDERHLSYKTGPAGKEAKRFRPKSVYFNLTTIIGKSFNSIHIMVARSSRHRVARPPGEWERPELTCGPRGGERVTCALALTSMVSKGDIITATAGRTAADARWRGRSWRPR